MEQWICSQMIIYSISNMICEVYDFLKNECILTDRKNDNIELVDVDWYDAKCLNMLISTYRISQK